MIHSMTGFARCEAKEPWGSLVWELRSVNHRFLETGLRLPEELRSLEPEFRKVIGQHLKRGKIDCSLRLSWSHEYVDGPNLDQHALDRLIGALEKVARNLPDPAQVSPLDLLRWPGVVVADEKDTGPVAESAKQLLKKAIEALRSARAGEGSRLRSMLVDRCGGMETLVAEARLRLPEIRERLRDKLVARIEQLKLDPDTERLEQEMAILAQKMDVDEELDRLCSHISEVRLIVDRDEAVGRRLDFLMQEFNREANTLASKSQDQGTTRIGVEMKVLIEQMREQIQNIE
jgi:uncharacterized protein (TIGR00255 family)